MHDDRRFSANSKERGHLGYAATAEGAVMILGDEVGYVFDHHLHCAISWVDASKETA